MIGVIGFGRFGRLAVRTLATDFEVAVYTRDTEASDQVSMAGGRPVSLSEVCAQKIVVLCIPISNMQAGLKEISPLLAPDTLVVDVCSVKVLPAQWMQALLPSTVEILATHPMFGPDSAATSVSGHKIVLCPERIAPGRYQAVKQWLARKEVVILETSPAEHDRQIAVSLALTHFIGRSLAEYQARPLTIDTEGYKRLLHILGVVTNDTWQLFEDMHHYNPYAQEVRQAFIEAVARVNSRLEE